MLSSEQVCLLTAVQRQGDEVLKATNMAAPASEDIEKIKKNHSGNCLVWIDGKTAYQRILNRKNCEFRVLGDHTTYTSVDHLNNVNSSTPRLTNGIASTEVWQQSTSIGTLHCW